MTGLIRSTLLASCRALICESTAGFFTDAEISGWIDDAAMDISSKTYCYEEIDTTSVVLTANQKLYLLPDDCLKVVGVNYIKGLKRITPSMEGVHVAQPTGNPEFFFEFASYLGLVPVPTTTETAISTLVTLYLAKSTYDITKIPFKFKTAAEFFVLAMAMIKDRQYAKAGAAMQTYLSFAEFDRQEIQVEKIEQPPPVDHYILKLTGPQR